MVRSLDEDGAAEPNADLITSALSSRSSEFFHEEMLLLSRMKSGTYERHAMIYGQSELFDMRCEAEERTRPWTSPTTAHRRRRLRGAGLDKGTLRNEIIP